MKLSMKPWMSFNHEFIPSEIYNMHDTKFTKELQRKPVFELELSSGIDFRTTTLRSKQSINFLFRINLSELVLRTLYSLFDGSTLLPPPNSTHQMDSFELDDWINP